MTTGNSVFDLKEGAGWSRGLDNLLDAELGHWFRTRKWWIQILIWAALVNLILFVVVISEEDGGGTETIMLFNILLGVFATIGVCILMQGAIVGEKQTGTVAWVLSQPVSRPAFVLAKLVGNTVGVAVTIVLAQGLIAYLLIYLGSGSALPLTGFMGGLGVHLIHLLFYLTFTLMLGAAFRRRGPVIAIPLVFLFVQQLLLGIFPTLANVLPWTLTVPLDNSAFPSVTAALMTGTEPLSYLPLATTLGVSVLFVAIALWVFERQEF
ncbi:MAG: ABC transporter permease subunit [Anaerolineae bacterium]|jgi:ABC-2 type transport system permease protein